MSYYDDSREAAQAAYNAAGQGGPDGEPDLTIDDVQAYCEDHAKQCYDAAAKFRQRRIDDEGNPRRERHWERSEYAATVRGNLYRELAEALKKGRLPE